MSNVRNVLQSVLCYNDPQSHPFISEKEKNYLKRELGVVERNNLPPVPFKAILSSPAFLALMFAQVYQTIQFVFVSNRVEMILYIYKI